jgi:hypothetical protein
MGILDDSKHEANAGGMLLTDGLDDVSQHNAVSNVGRQRRDEPRTSRIRVQFVGYQLAQMMVRPVGVHLKQAVGPTVLIRTFDTHGTTSIRHRYHF